MSVRNVLVTGAAGFIGSHLTDKLVGQGCNVIAIDNLSSGKLNFIQHLFENNNFKFSKFDLLKDNWSTLHAEADLIFHLAANPDVRSSGISPQQHIEQNLVATHNLLEFMRKKDVENIAFTSTSAVYGRAKIIPTPETYGPLIPESVYGATKLACEALISAYCHTYGIRAWIFRLANVIGPKLTHGVIFDFVNKLRRNPRKLEILGDGNQTKSYIYIDDCIDAMLLAVENSKEKVNIFNIGSEDQISVREIAKIVSEKMNLKPEFKFTGGEIGWKGDIPVMMLDISKIKSLGWGPKYDSKRAVELTAEWIINQPI